VVAGRSIAARRPVNAGEDRRDFRCKKKRLVNEMPGKRGKRLRVINYDAQKKGQSTAIKGKGATSFPVAVEGDGRS